MRADGSPSASGGREHHRARLGQARELGRDAPRRTTRVNCASGVGGEVALDAAAPGRRCVRTPARSCGGSAAKSVTRATLPARRRAARAVTPYASAPRRRHTMRESRRIRALRATCRAPRFARMGPTSGASPGSPAPAGAPVARRSTAERPPATAAAPTGRSRARHDDTGARACRTSCPASRASSPSRPRSPSRTRKAARCATAASTSRTSSVACRTATSGACWSTTSSTPACRRPSRSRSRCTPATCASTCSRRSRCSRPRGASSRCSTSTTTRRATSSRARRSWRCRSSRRARAASASRWSRRPASTRRTPSSSA